MFKNTKISKNYQREKDVLLIDYSVGNLSSISNALTTLGYSFNISNDIQDIKQAKALILPGVGAFAEAMNNLKELNIISTLEEEVVIKKKPILGICLGMQILADHSEENGSHEGLGWIEGEIKRLKKTSDFKVPHVGWNNLNIIKKGPLFDLCDKNSHFYFDHSYGFICEDKYTLANIRLDRNIAVAVQKDNIFGVQFHPEKSQLCGLKLFRSFFNYIND
jgi:glutamine amidotransferase